MQKFMCRLVLFSTFLRAFRIPPVPEKVLLLKNANVVSIYFSNFQCSTMIFIKSIHREHIEEMPFPYLEIAGPYIRHQQLIFHSRVAIVAKLKDTGFLLASEL